jgi:leader peptidase (prepilin peptidase)/N-methyltransferase
MPPPSAWVLAIALMPVAAAAGWLAARLVRFYAADNRPPSHFALIAATTTLFAWAAVVAPAGWVLAVSLGLGWTLVCLAAIDLTTLRLPDAFTLPLMAAGLAVAVFLPGRPILGHLAGAAVGWSLLAVLAWAWRVWRGVDGLGLGDAKLLGAGGAWLGWPALPSVLLIGAVMALAWVAVLSMARGRAVLRAPIAFGAPLALAIWIVWLHGPLVF